MSHLHDIDNTDPLFGLDSPRPVELSLLLEASAREPESPLISTQSRVFGPASCYQDDPPAGTMDDAELKGKLVWRHGASEPMLIPRSDEAAREPDVFSMSFASTSSSSSSYRPLSLLGLTSAGSAAAYHDVDTIVELSSEQLSASAVGKGKGKGRELPPTLPPLNFEPTELCNTTEWPPLAGPSSFDSGYSSMRAVDASPTSPSTPELSSESTPNTPEIDTIPVADAVRRRTFSDVSMRSRRSLSSPAVPKLKVKFATTRGAPGTIARKLLFRKSPPNSPRRLSAELDNDAIESIIAKDLSDISSIGQGSGVIPWARDLRSRSLLATPVVETNAVWGVVDSQRTSRLIPPVTLRTKGRAYTLPLSTHPVFDAIPIAAVTVLEPTPTIPDYFDDYLPHELKVHVLADLVALHTEEYEKRIAEGNWTVHKAGSSRNQWVGRDRGIKELFRLSRVSKLWRRLVFDGQLWSKLDLRAFPKLPPVVLVELVRSARGFIRELDLSGYRALDATTLVDSVLPYVTIHLTEEGKFDQNNLTYVNLQGCHQLTIRSIHELCGRSSSLRRLCLRGLSAVTDATCEFLARHCPKLTFLDLGRCPNITGRGVSAALSFALERGEQVQLKELRLSGLKGVNDRMMSALGRAAPSLEVLDLSYTTTHNSAIEAFVACTPEDSATMDTVQLSSREAGRDPTDATRYLRRVTRLRHLNLSSCVLLTDHACSHLAHAVPKLELLELAAIGPELREDGLVRLLSTTRYIRKLDLEDATEVNDAVLQTLTPSTPQPPPPSRGAPSAPEPGHALEHLTISYANVESDAIAELIRACPRLRVLEADNTRMTGLTLKDFVRTMRERKTQDAKVVAVDCRAVGEHAVKDLAPLTRPRLGWRSWHARKLAYLDGRDDEGLSVGQDECDPARVVIKTFYSWQTVDTVKAAREKKRLSGSRRGNNASSNSTEGSPPSTPGRARWWSPSGRRSTGPSTPTLLDTAERGDGCIIM